jgi:hypothetical protein
MQIEVGRLACACGVKHPVAEPGRVRAHPMIGTLPLPIAPQIKNVSVFDQATGYSFADPRVDLIFSLPHAGLPDLTALEIGK